MLEQYQNRNMEKIDLNARRVMPSGIMNHYASMR